MTVTYSREVCTVQLGGFAKLLVRWRGSIYRLMYREVLIFLAFFYALALLYRYGLTSTQQRNFEKFSKYCHEFTNVLPMTFVLGFYITLILRRWWEQFLELPWPDKNMIRVSWFVKGEDERPRMIRRTLARYLNLMSVLTLRSISVAVKKRFPTYLHLVEAGLMTDEELETIDLLVYQHPNWWIPGIWYHYLLREANKEGLITDSDSRLLNDDMIEYRQHCAMLWNYDWISIPLVYTQVVTIAVYSFFCACLLGRQHLEYDPDREVDNGAFDINRYFPFFTLIQFFFYMGWLKVAEELANPMGEDDDDFDLNWLIDRNLMTSFLIVDELCGHPTLVKDQFWNDPRPQLPYTTAAAEYKSKPFLGSAMDLTITEKQMEWLKPATIVEEEPLLEVNGELPSPGSQHHYKGSTNFLSKTPVFVQQLFSRQVSKTPSMALSNISGSARSITKLHRRQSSTQAFPTLPINISKQNSPTAESRRFRVTPVEPGSAPRFVFNRQSTTNSGAQSQRSSIAGTPNLSEYVGLFYNRDTESPEAIERMDYFDIPHKRSASLKENDKNPLVPSLSTVTDVSMEEQTNRELQKQDIL